MNFKHVCHSHVAAGVACNNVKKEEEEKEEEEEEEEVWKLLTRMVVELENSWKNEIVCVAVITPATDEDMYGNVVGCAKSNNMIGMQLGQNYYKIIQTPESVL